MNIPYTFNLHDHDDDNQWPEIRLIKLELDLTITLGNPYWYGEDADSRRGEQRQDIDKPATDWQVGDFAECPDGKTRRVVEALNTTKFSCPRLYFHDSTKYWQQDCTRVPKPERPELPSFCTVEEDGRITDRVACFTRSLEQWIAFYDGYDYQSRFIALRDWRALTGRMV